MRGERLNKPCRVGSRGGEAGGGLGEGVGKENSIKKNRVEKRGGRGEVEGDEAHQLLDNWSLPAPFPLSKETSKVAFPAVDPLQANCLEHFVERGQRVCVQKVPNDDRDQCNGAV